MAAPTRRDPLIAPRFIVEFGNKVKGAFREATVVSAEHELIEYKYADEQGHPGYAAIPGRMKYGRITLKRGMTPDMSIWDWRKEVEAGDVEKARVDGSVTMCDQNGHPLARFDFRNAWPLKVSGPTPNANSNEIAMEEVEIVCEQITRVKV